MSRKLFLFPRVSIKVCVCRDGVGGVGWGVGGGGGSCCMRVLRPLRVCVCVSVFVCTLDPVALQSSISVCLLI